MIVFAICDDQIEHAEILKNYIKNAYDRNMQKIDTIEINLYSSPEKMLNEMDDRIDIFIIDIECGNISGFDVAKKIIDKRKDAGIVFCTSYVNYVFQAFSYRPIGFIRKEYIREDIDYIMFDIINFLKDKKKILVLKDGSTIRLNEIVCIEVYKHDLTFKGIEKECKIRAALNDYEEILEKFGFIKISRSEMVNNEYVVKRDKNCLLMKDDSLHYISRSKISKVGRIFNDRYNL